MGIFGGDSCPPTQIITSDNGAYMGLGSLLGTVIGRVYSQDDISSAQDALTSVTTLVPLLQKAGTDELETSGPMLTPLADKLFQELSDMASAGYVPDYLGIMNRATMAASFQVQRQITEAQREQRRYGLGLNADVEVRLRTAQAVGVVTAYAAAAESARQFMWTASFDMLQHAGSEVERARIERLQLGGQFIAGAIDDYIEINNAYREIATVNVGEFAEYAEILATLLPLWFGPQWIQNSMSAVGNTIGSIL